MIGTLDKECPHCHALKFKNEPVGMCCSSGKVKLTEIETPPDCTLYCAERLIFIFFSTAIINNKNKNNCFDV